MYLFLLNLDNMLSEYTNVNTLVIKVPVTLPTRLMFVYMGFKDGLEGHLNTRVAQF